MPGGAAQRLVGAAGCEMDIAASKERAQELAGHGDLLAFLPLIMAIVSLASLLLLVQTSRVATAGYDIRRLEQLRESWRQRNYELDVEVSRLQSLERVETEARSRFHMVEPSGYVYVAVDTPPPVRAEVAPETTGWDESEPSVKISKHWWEAFFRPIFSR
ncbi:MAG: cell division protein FtsL [Chloroflexi bacterium]|nr:cell division protein FtsL [Chloroflexota bacterium]